MPASSPPLRVVIAGASGLLGQSTSSMLEAEGHKIVRLSREPGHGVYWNPASRVVDSTSLEGVDAVVNLSGRNLTAGRWSKAVKRDLYDSRIRSTLFLSTTLASLRSPPKVLISASAVGYYPSSRTAVHEETSSPGTDFLSTLCGDWEAATYPASDVGIRVVNLRIGVVMTRKGGMLAKVLPIFRFGLGGPIGDGGQWLSWIALPDLLALIRLAISDDSFSGPINAVSEAPVTNREFTKLLAKALCRPAILPVPEFAVSLLFGEMGRQTVLGSQNVIPKRLKELGFQWGHADLLSFLKSEVGDR